MHYSICESGRDVTVQAESSAEARRTVTDMFPGSVVTPRSPSQAMRCPDPHPSDSRVQQEIEAAILNRLEEEDPDWEAGGVEGDRG